MSTKLEHSLENKESLSLFASLSKGWGTRERTLIKDALIAKDNQLNPIIFCKKGSFLEKKAREKNLEVFLHHGKVKANFFKWYKFRYLSIFLSENKINFVHCYDLKILWVLCFILRNKTTIPLFLTIGSELKKSYLELWHKTLVSRVDQVFVFSQAIAEEVKLRLGFPLRKVTNLGYGVSSTSVPRTMISKVKKELGVSSKVQTVGSIMSPHHKNLDSIFPLIYAVIGYNQKYHEENELRLILISEDKWNTNPLYQDLIRFIKDSGSEENILFYSGATLQTFQKSVDLWIGIFEGYHITDYAIQALLNGVPILVPRNSEVMELMELYPGIGEAYRRDDSFGLREKMERVLKNKRDYEREVAKCSKKITLAHSEESYQSTLLERYQKLSHARKRAASKKKSSLSP